MNNDDLKKLRDVVMEAGYAASPKQSVADRISAKKNELSVSKKLATGATLNPLRQKISDAVTEIDDIIEYVNAVDKRGKQAVNLDFIPMILLSLGSLKKILKSEG